jgi:hypothetical protein
MTKKLGRFADMMRKFAFVVGEGLRSSPESSTTLKVDIPQGK